MDEYIMHMGSILKGRTDKES